MPFVKTNLDDLRQGISEFSLRYEPAIRVLWATFRHIEKPSFTLRVVQQGLEIQRRLRRRMQDNDDIHWLVYNSNTPGLFNLGGDLAWFAFAVRSGQEDALRAYARQCVKAVYNANTLADCGIATVMVVQGDAFGGGFEYAIAGDLLIAERGARFGFPEIRFGLFPGMGACSLLYRKVGDASARELMLSGRTCSAEELKSTGLVDILDNPHTASERLRNRIASGRLRRGPLLALNKARRCAQPLEYSELRDIVDIWVDTAMRLDDRCLRKMERIAKAQDWRYSAPARPLDV